MIVELIEYNNDNNETKLLKTWKVEDTSWKSHNGLINKYLNILEEYFQINIQRKEVLLNNERFYKISVDSKIDKSKCDVKNRLNEYLLSINAI